MSWAEVASMKVLSIYFLQIFAIEKFSVLLPSYTTYLKWFKSPFGHMTSCCDPDDNCKW
jgi:hypothetical protein